MSPEIIIDGITREQWQSIAADFSDYSIYQTWDYQQVRAEMDDQDVSRAIVREDGKVVAMCQVRIKHFMPLGLRIGYVQWGPLVRRKGEDGLLPGDALRVLKNAYLENKVNVFRIVPNAVADQTGQKLRVTLESAGFRHVPSVEAYRTFLLDVADSEQAMRANLRKSFRRDLKRAEKAGTKVEQGTDHRFCSAFKHLYCELLERKGFKGLDLREFMDTQARLPDSEKMEIVLVSMDGESAGALLSSSLGDTCLVLLAATSETGLGCGAAYLMWYEAATTAHRAGMAKYDLGGIDPAGNPNVYQFKSRMGGRDVAYIGAFEAVASKAVAARWWVAERAHRHLKR